jgi:phosphate transport system substrate-binding protein
MKNKDGNFVLPDDEISTAAAGADWSKSAFYEILTDKPGKSAGPSPVPPSC